MNQTKHILWIQVWGLALVQGAIAITWVIYNLYLVTLLTQFGFPEQLARGLVIVENILASIIEPLMGSLSDRLQHRMGTRFPLIALGMIAASALFLGIPAVLVFGGPAGFTRWLLPTVMVAWAIAMTVFRSPALSLLGRYAIGTHLPQAASVLTLIGGLAGALAPLSGPFILRMGPLFTFFLGSLTLLIAAAALQAVGPNQSITPHNSSSSPFPEPSSTSITETTQPLSLTKLFLVFGTGIGVALGFRLVMQTFPRVLANQAPDLNSRWVLGCIFISLAFTAIPAGRLITRLGMRLMMISGLVLMALLSACTLIGTHPISAFSVAIALGMTFSIVSNTTLPFALAMVPTTKAGLGTGIFFSGGAMATSLYGLVLAQNSALSEPIGALIGLISFLGAAVCVSVALPMS